MADEHVRLEAVVHGYVQGVGFRANTQHQAVLQGLTGWVCNQWDGTVACVAEGPRDKVEAFERYLHRGPMAATVDKVDITYADATGEFSAFNIRY